jgi:uncharacterized surface protein with fasciclin (FAS1) repeats
VGLDAPCPHVILTKIPRKAFTKANPIKPTQMLVKKTTPQLCLLSIILLMLLFVSCSQEPQTWDLKSQEQVIADYITSNPEQYSEFAKLIDATGMKSILSIRGPYTVFLPTNDAMFAYYKQKNVSSLADFDDQYLNNLIRSHIITNEISTVDFGLGALRDTNAIGDYVVTEFRGSEIILDKYAKVIKRDIRANNGYIHVIDQVIDPITEDIYTILSNNPSFRIFSEGIKLTGIKDTLQKIKIPYGKRFARTRYTLLAVPDSIYKKNGINNVEDLIEWTGANSDSLSFLNNPFYRYIEYHCLTGTHYLSELNSQLYPVLSYDNNVSMTIDTDYKINYRPQINKYTAFIIPSSNTPAKNGVIHVINDLLPVYSPLPQKIIFETTDFFDIQQEDCIGKYYQSWEDGQNTFAKIKWEGDYMQYVYKVNHGRSPILNYDCLSMLGFWWIEITTPKIYKGHYEIGANIWTGGEDLPIFDVFVDGKKVASINARIGGTIMDFGEAKWTKTEEHKIKLVCTGWGVLFWDTIEFTPVY